MIRERFDLSFVFATKRIDRLEDCLPPDWGGLSQCARLVHRGESGDGRLPSALFQCRPVRAKGILCEPLLGPVDLSRHLGAWIDEVIAGGESGEEARVCDYAWVLDLRRQCEEKGVAFLFQADGRALLQGRQTLPDQTERPAPPGGKGGNRLCSARLSGGRRRLDQGRIRAGKHIFCLRTGAPGCAAWSAKDQRRNSR